MAVIFPFQILRMTIITVKFLSHNVQKAQCLRLLKFMKFSLNTVSFIYYFPGRILNRFSKDMGAIDELLPAAMIDCLQVRVIILTTPSETSNGNRCQNEVVL